MSGKEKGPSHGSVRLYVEAALAPGAVVALTPEQGHYVFAVMRRRQGDMVYLFNGHDGEWRAIIDSAGKRDGRLSVDARTRPQHSEPDLWLLFAPLKRQRLEWLVEKATELGVARLQPVTTRHAVGTQINHGRLRAHAVEAAEQSQRLTVPEIASLIGFDKILEAWSPGRRLLVCDLGGAAPPIADVLSTASGGPWALFAGPEGGFSTVERDELVARDYVVLVSLGPRVLRAETAAIAALTVWQSLLGDWRLPLRGGSA